MARILHSFIDKLRLRGGRDPAIPDSTAVGDSPPAVGPAAALKPPDPHMYPKHRSIQPWTAMSDGSSNLAAGWSQHDACHTGT
ncbi:hypothetical protein CTA2_7901 [Colletotrichum tanaceti]|uniref:Uncharacterized protein n=1 Tax=Colletotrichum tanaceti TaxID=1306861 RepID=A0A4U6X1M3_9PEZI|nr:hypothetical protein CTA2_7914 [Colletotrichum tanaceti]KAJ0168285.1 hypothetical protein CTA2_7901 [Colletotrichum tanaceti]TKW48904.1 hypothetical protein CTA1_8566 [Colletotrichum tanaceti]